MNNLSWLIYAAQLFDNVGGAASLISVLSGIGIFLIGCCIGAAHMEGEQTAVKKMVPVVKKLAVVLCISLTFACVIPARRTMLLIAASEMGEKLIDSPQVASVVDPSIGLLKAWMVKETADLQKQSKN